VSDEYLDEDGYPTDEALKRIEEWPYTDIAGMPAFVKDLWRYPNFWTEEGGRLPSPYRFRLSRRWSDQESFRSPASYRGAALRGLHERCMSGQKRALFRTCSLRRTRGIGKSGRATSKKALKVLCKPREPETPFLVVAVPVVDAGYARQNVPQECFGHLMRTPDRSKFRPNCAAKIVRCPMRHREPWAVLFRSARAVGLMVVNSLLNRFLLVVRGSASGEEITFPIFRHPAPHDFLRAPDEWHAMICR
jgi:hypothetical protein